MPSTEHMDRAQSFSGHESPDRVTDTDKDSEAAQAVLNTAELCERILDYISATDLLQAQYITSQVRVIVKGSPKLRRKLFLSAAGHAEWNLGTKRHVLFDYGSIIWGEPLHYTEVSLDIRPLLLNHLVLEATEQLWGVKWRDNKIVGVGPLPLNHHNYWIFTPDTFDVRDPTIRKVSKDALCRFMFLTQTPATKVRIVNSLRLNVDCKITSYMEIVNAKDVTLGEVLEAMAQRDWNMKDIGFPDDVVVVPEVRDLVDDVLNGALDEAALRDDTKLRHGL